MTGIVILGPEIPGVDGAQRLAHEFERMIDQPLVVVAPGSMFGPTAFTASPYPLMSTGS